MSFDKIPIQQVTLPAGGILFFSDVHLGGSQGPPQERISRLIDRHRDEVRTVFILGDLFDFWYGYKTVVFSRFLPILFKLRELTEAGLEVHYIAGNHDFCLGDAFSEHLGVHTYDGAVSAHLGEQLVYLAHGDLINPRDRGYKLLHAVVRSRFMDWLIRMIPPDLGWKLAMMASGTSRTYSSGIKQSRREIFHAFAREVFDHGFDGVIMGHSHQPELTHLEHGGRQRFVANSGDWIHSFTYLLYQPDKGLTLMRDDPQSGEPGSAPVAAP